MKKFKISELEAFSGIKAHTIRIWEHRYSIFSPGRTGGNTRYYSLEEVKRLLDISLLLRHGYKISALAKMEGELLSAHIERLSSESLPFRSIHDLILLMYSSDIEEFEDVLDSCVLMAGVDDTLVKVIFPFLGRINLLSYADTSSETHFVVTALRKKIILAIESARPLLMIDRKALLFLSENEHYDLVLLYAAYILKTQGVRVLYLGTNVSSSSLQVVLEEKKPELLVTYIPKRGMKRADALVPLLKQHPYSKFFALTSGSLVKNSKEGLIRFVDYQDAREAFEKFLCLEQKPGLQQLIGLQD